MLLTSYITYLTILELKKQPEAVFMYFLNKKLIKDKLKIENKQWIRKLFLEWTL